MTSMIYRREAALLEAEVGDELVALDAAKGTCLGFNTVATSVWRALQEPQSFEDLRNRLLDEYDVSEKQCSNELRDLLRELESRGLVKTASR